MTTTIFKNPSEITGFLRGLRSVRRFASTPIPDDVLHDILEVGRWTGSSKNTQPWHLVVVRERSTLEQLSTCGPFAGHLKGAQVGLALIMQDRHQLFDEGRLAQNLMLAAWAHGVGSCIASIYPDPNKQKARQLLGVPDDRWLYTALSLGYPADERALRLSAERGALTTVPIGRRPLSDFVSWDRFSATSL